MTPLHDRPFPPKAEGRKPPNIKIFLKHHNDPEGRYAPQSATCQDAPEKHRVGCGGSMVFYKTYPNEARMPFDSAPIVVQQFPVRGDGAVIAIVETTNVHFATCPARKAEREKQRPTTGFADAKMRAAGGSHS